VHGGAAAVVRFLSGLVFHFVSYRRTLAATVVVSGVAVATIAGVTVMAALTAACALLGLTRGLLRVASGALVMDEATERSGAASSLYLAGLDLGKVLGPVAGGLGASAVGLRPTFLAAAVAFPVAYFALAAATERRRRTRGLDSAHGAA
jgi:MFS family permease